MLAFFLLVKNDVCEDKKPDLCPQQIQAHHCYQQLNRNLCCRTCMGFKTGDSGRALPDVIEPPNSTPTFVFLTISMPTTAQALSFLQMFYHNL